MTVNRSKTEGGPATLTISFDDPAAATTSATTAKAEGETSEEDFNGRTEVIDMKYKHESEILQQVMELTKAAPVRATPAEEAEMQELQEQKKRSTQDMLRNERLNEQKRQEKALLEQARGAAAVEPA